MSTLGEDGQTPPKGTAPKPLRPDMASEPDFGDLSDLAPRSLRGVSGQVPAYKQAEPKSRSGKDKRKPSSTAKPSGVRQAATKTRKNQWKRKLRLTREGKYFLGITMGVGFAAINTGNNLLYLLLGLMLSLIIVSGVMSELSIRYLTVKRRLPSRAQVGRSHLVEIEVFNDKRRVPSYAIEVEDLRADQPADKRCFFLKISPQSAQVAAYRRMPQRRGLEKHTGFRIATRFPFGLFEKSREVTFESELIIYPKVQSVRLPARGRGERAGETGPIGRGQGEEIFALRPMRDGEDPRDIYWRKSTIPGQFVLRERSEQLQREVFLKLDNSRPNNLDEEQLDAHEEAFEKRIVELASLAVAHIKRGDRVMLQTTDRQSVASGRERGIGPVLRFLALIDLGEEASPAPSTSSPHREESAA